VVLSWRRAEDDVDIEIVLRRLFSEELHRREAGVDVRYLSPLGLAFDVLRSRRRRPPSLDGGWF
jgi:hypothetical protein